MPSRGDATSTPFSPGVVATFRKLRKRLDLRRRNVDPVPSCSGAISSPPTTTTSAPSAASLSSLVMESAVAASSPSASSSMYVCTCSTSRPSPPLRSSFPAPAVAEEAEPTTRASADISTPLRDPARLPRPASSSPSASWIVPITACICTPLACGSSGSLGNSAEPSLESEWCSSCTVSWNSRSIRRNTLSLNNHVCTGGSCGPSAEKVMLQPLPSLTHRAMPLLQTSTEASGPNDGLQPAGLSMFVVKDSLFGYHSRTVLRFLLHPGRWCSTRYMVCEKPNRVRVDRRLTRPMMTWLAS
mmetsp:Transcript_11310/g.32532  ORF Transcript_11310/g.32532 Transcript_11310/m.32532 type:complete len:300 (+) Transcript_11310:2050-2949(+)